MSYDPETRKYIEDIEVLSSKLIGEELTKISVSNEGEHTLKLECKSGLIIYLDTDGDCCSESWWADILRGYRWKDKIISVEEIELPEPHDARSRQDVDQVYGLKIVTENKWDAVIELIFRNSSNGYYGGTYIVRTSDPYEGKVEYKEIEAMNWSN